MKTIEQILEEITNNTSVAGSVGTLLDWIGGVLKESQSTAAPSAAKTAVDAHIAELETHKSDIVNAVTANTSAAATEEAAA